MKLSLLHFFFLLLSLSLLSVLGSHDDPNKPNTRDLLIAIAAADARARAADADADAAAGAGEVRSQPLTRSTSQLIANPFTPKPTVVTTSRLSLPVKLGIFGVAVLLTTGTLLAVLHLRKHQEE